MDVPAARRTSGVLVGGYRAVPVPESAIPRLGQVYLSPKGEPALYVRTEQRPGGGTPEHLFALTRDRMVFSFWTAEVPPEFELIVDTEGRKQAREQEWLTVVTEHERDLAFELLKQACAWLPRERANELRRRWIERQPPEDV